MSNKKDITLNSSVLDIISFVLRGGPLHVRELSRLTRLSPTTAGSILNELEDNGILARKVSGRNHMYSINRNSRARKIAVMAEEHRAMKRLCSDPILDAFSDSLMKEIGGIKGMIDCIACSGDSILFVTSLDHETIGSVLSKTQAGRKYKLMIFTRENLRNNAEAPEIRGLVQDCFVLHGSERFIGIAFNL